MTARRWPALAVMPCAVLLASVDFNIVTIAIPSIQRGAGDEFQPGPADRRGYALSFASPDHRRTSRRSVRSPPMYTIGG